ncbi:S-adenosyl-L-methionine-dependent methyltransferase [Triangularia verruculosa]|uniref:Arsenite methyltransferase n=1 Tax=Triangularia verruculosa TaxID=2587418 RepID=A0AAN6XFJ2_9PEZI|nr:S-adenosyl-L-methionine-dependent methyltransferase [Triangularia verruculosa]
MKSTEQINDQIQEHNSTASRTIASKYGDTVAKSFGYVTGEELSSAPAKMKLGSVRGNPIAIDSLKKTIVDLGTGFGEDIFLASPKIGATSKAIGVDHCDAFLAVAEKTKASRGSSVSNVSFVLADVTSVPLPEKTADLIMANYVIVLIPRKDRHLVFKEMYRLLKPGGRVAMSSGLAKKPLPKKLREEGGSAMGGVVAISDCDKWFREAGFKGAVFVDTKADMNAHSSERRAEMARCSNACGSEKKTDLNEFHGIYMIFAVKE